MNDDDLDDIDPPPSDAPAPPPDEQPDAAPADEQATHYADVYEFVNQFLVVIYARRVSHQTSHFRWCPHWYEHPEAVARLEGLWKAFEHLRHDPHLGASTWWRDHADPTMTALTDPTGPFSACSPTSHAPPPPLPVGRPAWLSVPDSH